MTSDQPSPVERLFTALREQEPEVQIDRIRVKYPDDDDNVSFIRTGSSVEVQIDSYPDGQSPFIMESDRPGERAEASDIQEALTVILAWLAPTRSEGPVPDA